MQPEVERELVHRCRAGDTRFYEPLVRAYEPQGLRLALGMMGNADDARDALQEAFVKTYQSLDRFDSGRAFGPWFFQILRNQCRDMLRSRRARFRMEVVEDGLLEFRPDTGPGSAARHQARSDARRVLWTALEQLPEDQREVLVLKELQGLRYQEIASVLEVPEGTVASRLFHARKALKETLDEMGVRYP
ncbi:MAG: RNA polymerase sigma factor [Gemmatimonadota bacterium]